MPNIFAPFGLSYYDYEGGKENYVTRDVPLSLTSSGIGKSFGQGDTMGITTSSTNSGLVYTAWTTGTAGSSANAANYIMGVFTQVSYTTPQGQQVPGGSTNPGFYWPANTPTFNSAAPVVKLMHLPNTVWKVQCNGSLPALGAYGVNYGLIANGGVYNANNGYNGVPLPTDTSVAANPASGQSQQFLVVNNTGGVNNTNGVLKIIGLCPESTALPSNKWNDPYPVVLVKINLHFLSAPTVSTF